MWTEAPDEPTDFAVFRLNVDVAVLARALRPPSGARLNVALLAGQDGRCRCPSPVTAAPICRQAVQNARQRVHDGLSLMDRLRAVFHDDSFRRGQDADRTEFLDGFPDDPQPGPSVPVVLKQGFVAVHGP